MIRSVLNSLLYLPSRAVEQTPAASGLAYEDVAIETEDGERLHGWWVAAQPAPIGQILLCHGNAGNLGERVIHAELLAAAGFDVLLFDYRGYGHSSGAPTEAGTYLDARAARATLSHRPGVDGSRVFYLGESLGGAVALALALECPPRGLILQSTFTSVRDMGRLHYPLVPRALIPDAYPSLRRIRELDTPLLVLHGECDAIVPPTHGRAIFEAAPGPKRMHVFAGASHNDLVPLAGATYAQVIRSWAEDTDAPAPSPPRAA